MQKQDWKKVVAESNGTRVFLPEGFKKAQDEIESTRKKYNEDAVKMAEREIKMNVATQNMFLEIRNYLSKNGYPEIWVKELGFDANGLKEGVFVLNIRDNAAQ